MQDFEKLFTTHSYQTERSTGPTISSQGARADPSFCIVFEYFSLLRTWLRRADNFSSVISINRKEAPTPRLTISSAFSN